MSNVDIKALRKEILECEELAAKALKQAEEAMTKITELKKMLDGESSSKKVSAKSPVKEGKNLTKKEMLEKLEELGVDESEIKAKGDKPTAVEVKVALDRASAKSPTKEVKTSAKKTSKVPIVTPHPEKGYGLDKDNWVYTLGAKSIIVGKLVKGNPVPLLKADKATLDKAKITYDFKTGPQLKTVLVPCKSVKIDKKKVKELSESESLSSDSEESDEESDDSEGGDASSDDGSDSESS
jgi:hypothetical protein